MIKMARKWNKISVSIMKKQLIIFKNSHCLIMHNFVTVVEVHYKMHTRDQDNAKVFTILGCDFMS